MQSGNYKFGVLWSYKAKLSVAMISRSLAVTRDFFFTQGSNERTRKLGETLAELSANIAAGMEDEESAP